MLKKWFYMYVTAFALVLLLMMLGNMSVHAQNVDDGFPEEIQVVLNGNGGLISTFHSDEPQEEFVFRLPLLLTSRMARFIDIKYVALKTGKEPFMDLFLKKSKLRSVSRRS